MSATDPEAREGMRMRIVETLAEAFSEPLARALVEARLRHFGYGNEWIKAHENPPDHEAMGCELVPGLGWLCDDDEMVSRHPDHDTYATEADNIMFVLEAEPLTAHLADVLLGLWDGDGS